jgi:hypothetical protein
LLSESPQPASSNAAMMERNGVVRIATSRTIP